MPSTLTSMFGRFYGEVGSTDKDLILNTRGEVKVRVGKKFFNLFKNGKVSGISDSSSISYTEDISQETSNGFYIDSLNSIYLVYGGTAYELGGTGQTSYVSFNNDLEVTRDQKELALKNIGFYYDTLDDAEEVSQGIVYVKDQNALYININGELKNYFSESGSLDKLVISDGEKRLVITPSTIEGLVSIGNSIELLNEGIIVESILNSSGSFKLDDDGLEVNKLRVSDLTININSLFAAYVPPAEDEEEPEEGRLFLGETSEDRILNTYYTTITSGGITYSCKMNYWEIELTVNDEDVITGYFYAPFSSPSMYIDGKITDDGYFITEHFNPTPDSSE